MIYPLPSPGLQRRLLCGVLLLSCSVFFCGHRLQAQQQERPNIIFILADDLGWADLSCNGSSFYETPNLDRLASSGIRFTENYTSSPVCSPTRAAFLTGKNPVNTGVTDWIKGRQADGKAKPYEKFITPATAYQLALEESTLAEYARSAGYQTFLAGKWHLGEEEKYWPEHQGFQINKGGWSAGAPTRKVNDSTGGFFTPYGNPRLSDGPRGEYLTDRLTDECMQFIDSNGKRPFFMVYSLYAVHNPMQAPAPLIKKYMEKMKGLPQKERFAKDQEWMLAEAGWKRRLVQDNPVYAAMIENMDWNIGRLLDKLAQMGIADNTLVIFTSDNGGLSTAEGSPTVNGPLRAGKGWLYEGGIRVPLILYWKGKVKAGAVSSVPVITTDFFPTLAQVMDPGFRKNGELEGESLFDLIASPGKFSKRPLYWHYPHYSNQGGKPGSAIRKGKYKLLYDYETEKVELYDLRKDVSENHDLAPRKKRLAARMNKRLFDWLQANGEFKPRINPGFDPSALRPPGSASVFFPGE